METVPDSTDPGTLRPDIDPEIGVGTGFKPLECPYFDKKINLPDHIAPDNAFGIWSLFFTQEQLEHIVESTNAYIPKPTKPPKRSRTHTKAWNPLTIEELYAFLGIWIYMGLHVENTIADYWATAEHMPRHIAVHKAMGRTRWQDINARIHISMLSTNDVFDMVYTSCFLVK